MSPLASGVRRQMVTLENPSAPIPTGGDYTETWTSVTRLPVFAQIVPATARAMEKHTAGTALTQATHVVTLPYLADVTTQTRVVYGARIFNVLGVENPDERCRELVLVCAEVMP